MCTAFLAHICILTQMFVLYLTGKAEQFYEAEVVSRRQQLPVFGKWRGVDKAKCRPGSFTRGA